MAFPRAWPLRGALTAVSKSSGAVRVTMKNADQRIPSSKSSTPFLIDLAKWASTGSCRKPVSVQDYTTLEDLPAYTASVGNSQSAFETSRTDVNRETTDED